MGRTYNNAQVLSKIKVGANYYYVKDADARAILDAISDDVYEKLQLNLGAMEDNDKQAGLAVVSDVKAYVNKIAELSFDVVKVETLPEAAEAAYETYHNRIVLVPDVQKPAVCIEYIIARGGAEGAYTYTWEQIGTSETDLADYVKKTCKIAGIDLADDITAAELQAALGLKGLAYKDTASGKVSTVDSASVTFTPAGTVTVNDLKQTATAATLTTADYTPAGSITGTAIAGGDITVTLKNKATAAEATLTTAKFTPAGTVAAVEGGSFSALKTAVFGEDAANGIQISGDVSAPAITLTSAEKTVVTGLTGGKVASFSEGAFTPAAINDGFFTAGSQASYSHTGFSGGSLGAETKNKFVKKAMNMTVGSGEDAECLIISEVANTDTSFYGEAVTAQGTYTPAEYGTDNFTANTLPSIDKTKFFGGEKAADTFTANELQSATEGAVNDVTAAALASAPVFTGKKYRVATTDDVALKTVAFTATNSADIVNKVTYVQPEIDEAFFTPVAATLGFAGTVATDLKVTAVNYDRATANGATFAGDEATEEVALTKTEKTVTVQ